jgi:hypothetical protein
VRCFAKPFTKDYSILLASANFCKYSLKDSSVLKILLRASSVRTCSAINYKASSSFLVPAPTTPAVPMPATVAATAATAKA